MNDRTDKVGNYDTENYGEPSFGRESDRVGTFVTERAPAPRPHMLENETIQPTTRPHFQQPPPPPPPVPRHYVDRVQTPGGSGIFESLKANLVPLMLIGVGVGLLLSKGSSPRQTEAVHTQVRPPAHRGPSQGSNRGLGSF